MQRRLGGADLDELESHLLDEVDRLVAQGQAEPVAWNEAVLRLGHHDLISTEYHKHDGRITTHSRFPGGPFMVSNYLKIALRTLRKHKGYAVINIGGLAIAMAACLLMVRYVQDELSYDRFHTNADQIYRVTVDLTNQNTTTRRASLPYPAAPLLEADYPGIEQAVRFQGVLPNVIAYQDKQFIEERIFMVDGEVFDVFSFEMVQGDPATAIRPGTVVLTESTARRYFGEANPLGQTLRYGNRADVEVTGVVRDVPQNAHFQFDVLLAYETIFGSNMSFIANNWSWSGFYTYILLEEAASPAQLESQLADFVQTHYPEERRTGTALHLQPLADIHLYSDLSREIEANGSITYVYLFSGIVLLILLVACINFMNLATARSARRAKEVGLRKVMGAQRRHLIRQFLGEALLMAFVALALGLLLAQVALPYFNTLTGKGLDLGLFSDGALMLALLVGTAGVGMLAGSYPAFFLSSFLPARVLKGVVPRQGGHTVLRKGLVVSQFVVSIILLVCILAMYAQLDYMRSKELGFDKEQVVLVKSTPDLNQQLPAFKAEIVRDPAIQGASSAYGAMLGGIGFSVRAFPEGGPEEGQAVALTYVDHDFADLFNLNVTEGRFFSTAFPADSTTAFVINETAAKAFGWDGEALGKQFAYYGGGTTTIEKTGQIVGVISDFHFQSLHEPVGPMALTLPPPFVASFNGSRVAVKIAPEQANEAIALLEETWARFVPDRPFEFAFMDAEIDRLYEREARLMEIVQVFTFLAIFIACLGLFGLASFTAEQRTKEIGVRKALGASLGSILVLVSSSFVRLVGVAFVLSAPIAYFILRLWLDTFAYRIDLGLGLFFLAGALALLIALVTVGYQAFRAAGTNPVEALRYE